MNAEIKTKWLEALRSGEYQQGREALLKVHSYGQRYCCLGVLCDLYRKETGRGRWEEPDPTLFDSCSMPFVLGNESTHGLPLEEVRAWAELSSNSPKVEFNGGLHPIDKINDDGASFEEIANLIETQL